MKNKSSGQITVFLAIILLSVFMFAGLLVDISRINAGRAMVKRAVETAAKSLLADYDSRLKENYGLFAIPATDMLDLKDLFEEYLACNLSITDNEYYKGNIDLFGFRIEKVSVTPIFNLSENIVTKKQILEYMKYRAPAQLVEGFMERLAAVREVGKMSAAYKKKVGIDKILGSMDKAQQNLKKSVDGSGYAADKYINGFNLDGSWEEAYNSFNSLKANLDSVKNSLESVNNSISFYDSNNHTNGSKEDTDNEIDSLKEKRSALQQTYSETNSQLLRIWNEIRYGLTDEYMRSNNNAIKEIEKIVERGKKAQVAIAELEGYLRENFGNEEGAFSKAFKDQTQTELKEIKSLILDGQIAEKMLSNADGNISLLSNVAAMLDETGISGGFSSVSGGGLPAELLDMIKGYANISYDYSKPAAGDKKDDPRAGKAEAVKELIIEKILKDVNYKTEGIDEKELPSQTKVITESFDMEDEGYLNKRQTGVGNLSNTSTEPKYEGNLESIDKEVNLYDEDGMFQENALSFISAIGNLVTGEAAALRDNIYLNEYIMGTFKNSVSEMRPGNETIKDTNLSGSEKASLETFYESEVEYVLHGNASQKLNKIMTKGKLLLVRFGLNTLHAYADGKKKTMAASIATAVAGWWTGGAGIPVISNLIMCGWGMGEAVIDVSDLMNGKSVPIYKLNGDWKLDVGLPTASGPKIDRRLYFNYHDYLRLFLLTMNENKKLDRLEDLIQLNLGKSKSGLKMSEYNTYVRVEAEISMKYLFITQPFIQKTMKTNDGRYVFKVLVYEGY